MPKPLIFNCPPSYAPQSPQNTSLAVSIDHANQIREIAYKTHRPVKDITDELLAYALSNVELREAPLYETRYVDDKEATS